MQPDLVTSTARISPARAAERFASESPVAIDVRTPAERAKKWIDGNLDHRMLLCRDDPFVPLMQNANEPVFLMDDNPTAENIAKLIWTETRKQGLPVSEVRVWETSTSRAMYRGEAWSE
jgi:6-pyruvoyltetrahydropterin/6-carboxytetrahydropterin synthase